ncbi:MAG: YkgJ family cysteine cluster protein [Chitinophagales bacterium]|nr:YkgJ family cysteine cluster protein [Chitinophagales bacterium]
MSSSAGSPLPVRIAAGQYALLPEIARTRREENLRFLRMIQSVPSERFDRVALPIAQEQTERIDCTLCANCCRSVQPGVLPEELPVLARCAHMEVTSFSRQWVKKEAGTGIAYLHRLPCLFLQENRCSIYNDRPLSCRDYPHLQHPGLKFRLRSLISQYSVCPIVFNTLEALKEAFGFSATASPNEEKK